ncbi:MAG TPA: hypothetical protein VIS57_03685 [Xanthomonadales bacterium]
MQGVLKTLLGAALLLVAWPLFAQTSENVQTPVLPLSGQMGANEMARVVTFKGRPEECLAPLAVTRIDGEMRAVSAQGFLIEPGLHTINGRATLDVSHCPLSDRNAYIRNSPDLEVEFEAGSTYYIGYYHGAADTAEWKLMVWHIEASPLIDTAAQLPEDQ